MSTIDEVIKTSEKIAGTVEEFKKTYKDQVLEQKNYTEAQFKEVENRFDKEHEKLENLKKEAEKNYSSKKELEKAQEEIKSLKAELDKGLAVQDKLTLAIQKGYGLSKEVLTDTKEEETKLLDFMQKRQAIPHFDIKEYRVDTDPAGGYAVLPYFSGYISRRLFESSEVRKYANVENLLEGKDSYTFLIKDNKTTSFWVGEGETISEGTTPEMGEGTLKVKGLGSLQIFTQNSILFPSVDLVSEMRKDVSKDFISSEESAFISGNGLTRPKGILSYDGWGTVGTYERNKLERINTGSAAALTTDSFIELETSLQTPYLKNSIYMMKRSTWGQVALLKDGQDNYIFGYGRDRDGKKEPYINNFKVVYANDMPTVEADALVAILGDFSGYKIVERAGIQIRKDESTLAAQLKTRFIFSKYVDGGVTDFSSLKVLKVSAT